MKNKSPDKRWVTVQLSEDPICSPGLRLGYIFVGLVLIAGLLQRWYTCDR